MAAEQHNGKIKTQHIRIDVCIIEWTLARGPHKREKYYLKRIGNIISVSLALVLVFLLSGV